VRCVADLALMGLATVLEARGLLRWLRDEGVEHAGVAGYSMGGQLAAMAGASLPWPVALVPMAPAASPAWVFTEGPMSRGVAWDALGEPDRSRERLRSTLLKLSVLALPAPRDPARAIVVGTSQDGVVPPAEMEAIAAHWRGAELRWLPAGHVSGVLLQARALRRAVLDAFARGGLDLSSAAPSAPRTRSRRVRPAASR
jgi:dienelactone hydrolase